MGAFWRLSCIRLREGRGLKVFRREKRCPYDDNEEMEARVGIGIENKGLRLDSES
jgi:hypothetical protein